MTTDKIVRSWKDEDYWQSLSDAERMLLPDNPASLIELTDAELSGVDGGTERSIVTICGPSVITFCTTWDFRLCSWFGCPTW